jgi:hypothetical protein
MVKQRLFAAFAVCIVALLSVPALAQMPQPFSADFSRTSANGNVHVKGKFFVSAPKMRMEMADSGQQEAAGAFGVRTTIITDVTTKMAYMLMPEPQMYIDMPLDPNDAMMQRMPKLQYFAGDPCTGRTDATCKKLGTEAINGRPCDKWEVTEKSGNKETLWMDQKIHFPIKSQTAGGTTSEFTNIQEGAQDPALFKVPAGYRKLGSFVRPHACCRTSN